MKKLLTIASLVTLSVAWAQNAPRKHWVFLNETQLNFATPMLGMDALQRRSAQSIALRSTDFALQPDAVAAVARVAEPIGRSRWLRAVVVQADEAQLRELEALPWCAPPGPWGS